MDEARLYRDSGAERWGVTPATLKAALDRSVAKAFAGRTGAPDEVDRYVSALHLGDLALACACADGHDRAWDHFVSTLRPVLYRAADAIDASGGAREVADAIYGELFSRSLFKYFHGSSSLATWLRSLLSQRYVDRYRESRRLDPLPDEATPAALPSRDAMPDPDRSRFAAAMQAVLAAAVAALAPRDRLRMRCYYAEEMTLAQIGRVTREHEATVSRQLARTRKDLRESIERGLREDHGFTSDEVRECISAAVDDAGTLDLAQLLGARKEIDSERSMYEDAS
jgi:RNA polymerase sigma factor (sigma-70 family)